MADKTHIQWTDATWNIVTGCTRISDGCTHCYIERTPPFRIQGRSFDGPQIGATTGVQLHPDRLGWPLHWRKPRRIFVCSLADLFHEQVPDEFIARAFAVHAFAASIGLRRSWFQDKGDGRWHYDVTESKRQAAITADAKAIGLREMGEFIRQRRTAEAAAQPKPSPEELWRQAGGGTEQFSGERYRELMIEHGLLVPLQPGEKAEPLPCGWPHRRTEGVVDA